MRPNRFTLRRIRRICIFVCLCSALSFAARASTLISLSLDQLTQRSDLIVHGHVVSHKSRWHGSEIYTECVVERDETIRGPNSSRFHFFLRGGEIGDIGMKVLGEASCADKGQELVILASKIPRQALYKPVGMSQGWFEVQRTDKSSPKVFQNLSSIQLLTPHSQKRSRNQLVTKESKTSGLPLEQFLATLRQKAAAK